MESNVFPIPTSNDRDKLLPVCLRFMVNSYCSLFLLATLNPRHLIRSPLKEGRELLNGKPTSEPKEVVKAGRPSQQIGNALGAITGANVVAGNNSIQKKGVYSKDMGISQETEGRNRTRP